MISSKDPLNTPEPEDWIALDGSEHIELVMDYHIRAGIEMPDVYVHSSIQAVTEY